MAANAADDEPAPLRPAPLWDEERFQRLVRKAARLKGLSLTEVGRLSGTSQHWLTQPATTTGRGIEKVLQIARVLDIDPIDLFGGPSKSRQDSQARLRLLTTISTVTAHLVAALQLADDSNADRILRGMRTALLQILREIEESEEGNSK